MHIISLKALREFWLKHPAAERPLRDWHSIIERTGFVDLNDLRQAFRSADYVPPYTIFNVGGNKYRIITMIRYALQRVYIRWVMTHEEYDGWCKKYRSGKL